MLSDQKTDVLVIGTGGSGMMAATRAAQLGGDVIIADKSPSFGGTTALSGGCLWIPQNHLQTDDIKDSKNLSLSYLKNLTKGEVSQKILETYVENAQKMLLYLEKIGGISLSLCPEYCDYYPEISGGIKGRTVEPDAFDGELLGKDRQYLKNPQKMTLMFGQISLTAKEAHTLIAGGKTGRILALKKVLGYFLLFFLRNKRGRDRRLTLGQGLVAGMWKMMKNQGVKPMLGTAVVKLLTQDGRVCGALMQSDKGFFRLWTKKGVIMACGGFSRNESLKQKYYSKLSKAEWGAAVEQDQGDALKFCPELAPKLGLMSQAWWMPVMRVPNEDYARSVVVDRSMPGSFVVDQKGHRFVNESAPYEDFVMAMREDASRSPCWLVTDSFHRKNYSLGPLLPGSHFPDWTVKKGLIGEFVLVADSMEELAEKIKVPKENLLETQKVFNRFAKEGKDPMFQRGLSEYDRYYADKRVTPNPCLRALLEGPFYAAKLYPGDFGSKGGFVVDENAQVLNERNEPIEGLYAAGNAAANPLGNTYPGAGGTLGPGLTFGYIAGEAILKGNLQIKNNKAPSHKDLKAPSHKNDQVFLGPRRKKSENKLPPSLE